MMRQRAGALCLVGAVALLATVGCQYPISSQLRREAVRGLSVPMVRAKPQAYRGDVVIWGGKVLAVTNKPDMTELIVLDTPLDSYEEPLSDAYADGRFIARTSRFLDPEVYSRGRTVTLAGRVLGTQRQPVGQTQYTYPVVQIEQIYAWTASSYYDYGYSYPGYYGGPYWWPYYPWGPAYGYGGAFFYGGPYYWGGEGGERHEGHEGGHEHGR